METSISITDEGLVTQGTTFCANVDSIAGPCGLDSAKVAQVKVATVYYIWTFTVMNLVHAYSKAMTEYKDLVKGIKGGTVMKPVPVMGTIPTMPAVPTNPDLRQQLIDLVQDAKRSKNFTPDAARSVGVLVVPTPFVPGDGKPNLTVKLATGGHPLAHATMGDFEAYLLQKDSGSGYADVLTAMHPDALDHGALPGPGKSEVWKYRAIYMYKGEVVGHYSNEVIITVYGY